MPGLFIVVVLLMPFDHRHRVRRVSQGGRVYFAGYPARPGQIPAYALLTYWALASGNDAKAL